MNAAPALPLPNYEAAKRAARAARPGDTLYPRLFVRDGGWTLQRTPGTSPVPVSTTHARAILSGEVA
jgi:hypothetical protein